MQDVDLNLMRVFVAIYETGGVSGAATRLNLTQPSVSHSLARLRDLFGDQLFSRTRRGMDPTSLASALYPTLRTAMDSIEEAVARTRAFQPSESRRRFRLALTDLGAMVFLAPIMNRVLADAPSVTLEVLPLVTTSLHEDLFRGRIDAAICANAPTSPGGHSQSLFEERYQCVFRRDHPRLADRPTLDQFVEEKLVLVASSSGHHVVEEALNALGIKPNVSAQVPHLGVLETLLSETDLLVVVPSRVASIITRRSPLLAAELPLEVPNFDVRFHWHDHGISNPEQTWFRTLVMEALTGL